MARRSIAPQYGPTEAAFRRAICAAPDDDTPRLVFADWLDENDRPERAAFIRIQCERAKTPAPSKRAAALDRQARKLFQPAWQGRLAERMYRPVWRRGFLDEVSAYSKRFAATAHKIFELEPVTGVVLQYLDRPYGNVPIPDLLAAPYTPRLRRLDFGFWPPSNLNTLSEADCDAVIAAGPGPLANLRSLALRTNDPPLTQLRQLLAALPSLTEFEFNVGPGGVRWPAAMALANTAPAARLERLTLHLPATDDAGTWLSLLLGVHLTNLRELTFRARDTFDTATFSAPQPVLDRLNTSAYDHLERLTLPPADPAGLRQLRTVTGLTGLRFLKVPIAWRFTDEDARALAVSPLLTPVKAVHLVGRRIDRAAVRKVLAPREVVITVR